MARNRKNEEKEVELDSYESEHIEFESNEEANLSLRNSLREQLNSDVEAFLAAGGQIETIDANVIADPPKKPESNYGGQPI